MWDNRLAFCTFAGVYGTLAYVVLVWDFLFMTSFLLWQPPSEDSFTAEKKTLTLSVKILASLLKGERVLLTTNSLVFTEKALGEF